MGRDYNKSLHSGKVTKTCGPGEKTGKNIRRKIKALISGEIPPIATLRHGAELAKSAVVLPCPPYQHNQHYFCCWTVASRIKRQLKA
ncbi:hypothetical protein [Rheinheimera sp. 4Y26]|uniref:hypothetical protein n=1 Tax=Rheinheimera sp. 4Y26 TaxID=2977811 RepID=UPI0021B11099|nr:hypothetical protein [Rheinheimera sp. 4Y26]MCT6698939.1 hypothetical protein [Rheinheimera sp. 4Y26]